MSSSGQFYDPDTIFLIGFMGCGKTTWGCKLAARMGYAFIDLDELFVQDTGSSIAEYFNRYGENQFRIRESAILKETPYKKNTIVSTGGGLPCFFDHMQWMNATGRTVYIKLNPKALAARLENAKTVRPVLQGKRGDELVAFIAERLTEREVYYNQATYTIGGIDLSIEKFEALIGQRK